MGRHQSLICLALTDPNLEGLSSTNTTKSARCAHESNPEGQRRFGWEALACPERGSGRRRAWLSWWKCLTAGLWLEMPPGKVLADTVTLT